MRKRMMLILLAVVCVVALVFALPAGAEEISGTCGEGVNWVLKDGILTISGTGEMYGYDGNNMPPWSEFSETITKVVINDGVTTLSHVAFTYLVNLETVEMADSVTYIGGNAFSCCVKLVTVELSENVKFIGDLVFRGCTSLKEIHIPASVEEMDTFTFWECTALESVWFYGDAPFVDMPFEGLTLTAYYPAGNETWTDAARAEFGGDITWLEHGGNEGTEPVETQPEETEPEETEPEETTPVETKPQETEPEETKPTEIKPQETEPEETQPQETEPEETQPQETEPEVNEPVVPEPEDTEPDQTQPGDTEPEDTEPQETNPEQTQQNPVRKGWWVIVGIVAAVLVIGPMVALIVLKSKK